MSLHKRTKRRPTYTEYGIKNGVVIEIERVVDGLSAIRKLSRNGVLGRRRDGPEQNSNTTVDHCFLNAITSFIMHTIGLSGSEF